MSTITVSQLLRELRNGFPEQCFAGTWTSREGVLTPTVPLPEDGWISLAVTSPHGGCQRGIRQVTKGRIEGLGDGSWQGRLWVLHPPEDLLSLHREIAAWAAQAPQPGIQRESFGAYSRTAVTQGGRTPCWQEAFASALRPYRRMFPQIPL